MSERMGLSFLLGRCGGLSGIRRSLQRARDVSMATSLTNSIERVSVPVHLSLPFCLHDVYDSSHH